MRKSLVLVALFLTFSGSSEARLVKSMKKDCLVCHENWLLESKKESKKLLLNTSITAADELMCLSCHDGSLADDRLAFTNFNHFSHPVNVKVPKSFHLPKQFPLKDGKLYCGTCHTPHTETGSENKIDYAFMRVPNVNSALCIACHKENGEHGLNHPVLSDTKPLSPEQVEKVLALHGRVSSDNRVECESCHSAHEATGGRTLIAGVKNSALCLVCHENKIGKRNHRIHVALTSFMNADGLIGNRLVDGKVECLTCHKMHKEENRYLTVEKPETICAACHTAEKPALFSPHNVKGEGCLSCHLAHNAKTDQDLFARKPSSKGGFDRYSVESKECIACHNGGVSSHVVGSAANSHKGECVSCHNPHIWNPEKPEEVVKGKVEGTPENSFLIMPGEQLCVTCHGKRSVEGTFHDLRGKDIKVRNALGTPVNKAGLCESCHVPHRAVGAFLWGIKETTSAKKYIESLGVSDKESKTCLTCHYPGGIAADVGEITHPTGKKLGVKVDLPVGEGGIVTCGTCHDPHKWSAVGLNKNRAAASFLRVPEWSLCLKCHADKIGALSNVHASIKDKNVLGETPDEAGVCAACHVPHKAVGSFLRGVGTRKQKEFCLVCHSNDVMKSKYHDHPMGIKNPVNVLPGKKITCYTCHDPHTMTEYLLRIKVSNNSELCLTCHKKEDTTHSSHDFTQVDLPAKEKAVVAKFGKCALCHTPHNPKFKFLWSMEPVSGKTLDEKLCLTCHGKSGFAEKIGEHSHPIGDITNVYVKYSGLPLIEGKIDCATCHNPHGGKDRVRLTRKTVSGDSELCLSCHERKGRVIGTDHDFRVLGDKKVAEEGVCSGCHTPHNAKDVYLWNVEVKRVSSNVMNDLCLTCHSEGGMAQNKSVKYYFHPYRDIKTISVDRPGRHGDWPIYDNSGRRVKVGGAIVCETCHDPHVWSRWTDRGPGKLVEGNIRNSFLRNDTLKGSICVDCHGVEALLRYKLFHNAEVHAKHPFTK